MSLNILVACERFAAVRDALRARGFNAVSCDIEESETPGPHIRGYLEDVIGDGSEWDFIIAFPPCTYLCVSGLHWNGRVPGRKQKTEYALNFVVMIANCMRRAKYGGVLENPVGCISTRVALVHEFGKDQYVVLEEPNPKHGFKPEQSIQPYEFGADASKETCLWIVPGRTGKQAPKLWPTSYIEPRTVTKDGKTWKRWGNQTDSGQNKLGPSDDRAVIRGKTYTGVAEAMAEQWGRWLLQQEKK